jgi:hypothetical protein
LSSSISVTIDPANVLGVGLDATLQEIRDAYRSKAKRYHPDAGGEDWAFRILVESYEFLSTARVTRAAAREEAAPPRRPAAHAAQGFSDRATPPPRPEAGPRQAQATDGPETLRPGVQETARDPALVVNVEKLSIRYQFDHIWLITEHGSENRVLSCSLNIAWPDPKLDKAPASITGHETILQNLQEGFDRVAAETTADSARSAVVDGRFNGWLSYPSAERASEAFDRLSGMLHMVGLSVHQWSRDLIVPRHDQSSR